MVYWLFLCGLYVVFEITMRLIFWQFPNIGFYIVHAKKMEYTILFRLLADSIDFSY